MSRKILLFFLGTRDYVYTTSRFDRSNLNLDEIETRFVALNPFEIPARDIAAKAMFDINAHIQTHWKQIRISRNPIAHTKLLNSCTGITATLIGINGPIPG